MFVLWLTRRLLQRTGSRPTHSSGTILPAGISLCLYEGHQKPLTNRTLLHVWCTLALPIPGSLVGRSLQGRWLATNTFRRYLPYFPFVFVSATKTLRESHLRASGVLRRSQFPFNSHGSSRTHLHPRNWLISARFVHPSLGFFLLVG